MILSEYDRISAGWYDTIDNSALHLKNLEVLAEIRFFLKKNQNLAILNPAPIGVIATDFLDLECIL